MAEQRQSTFALDIRKWCEQAKENADQVVRGVVIECLTRIVDKSPVGNPELWAANKEAVSARANFNANVERDNAIIDANPLLTFRYGKLKKKRKLAQRTIDRRIPLPAGKNYVGGAFKKNWQTTVGSPAVGTLSGVDPTGGVAIAKGQAVAAAVSAGAIVYITNNLPYSHRLEFDSWSSQAPAGMVRVTVAEYSSIVSDAVKALP